MDLKKFIIDWDNKYPWDLWWRKKYNIPFGSNQHKEQCLVASALEYIEFVELEKDRALSNINKNSNDSEFLKNALGLNNNNSNIMPKSEQKISEEEFKELNLDDF